MATWPWSLPPSRAPRAYSPLGIGNGESRPYAISLQASAMLPFRRSIRRFHAERRLVEPSRGSGTGSSIHTSSSYASAPIANVADRAGVDPDMLRRSRLPALGFLPISSSAVLIMACFHRAFSPFSSGCHRCAIAPLSRVLNAERLR
jgi:hypothetical protein